LGSSLYARSLVGLALRCSWFVRSVDYWLDKFSCGVRFSSSFWTFFAVLFFDSSFAGCGLQRHRFAMVAWFGFPVVSILNVRFVGFRFWFVVSFSGSWTVSFSWFGWFFRFLVVSGSRWRINVLPSRVPPCVALNSAALPHPITAALPFLPVLRVPFLRAVCGALTARVAAALSPPPPFLVGSWFGSGCGLRWFAVVCSVLPVGLFQVVRFVWLVWRSSVCCMVLVWFLLVLSSRWLVQFCNVCVLVLVLSFVSFFSLYAFVSFRSLDLTEVRSFSFCSVSFFCSCLVRLVRLFVAFRLPVSSFNRSPAYAVRSFLIGH